MLYIKCKNSSLIQQNNKEHSRTQRRSWTFIEMTQKFKWRGKFPQKILCRIFHQFRHRIFSFLLRHSFFLFVKQISEFFFLFSLLISRSLSSHFFTRNYSYYFHLFPKVKNNLQIRHFYQHSSIFFSFFQFPSKFFEWVWQKNFPIKKNILKKQNFQKFSKNFFQETKRN